jgi:flagellar export protein FliJ
MPHEGPCYSHQNQKEQLKLAILALRQEVEMEMHTASQRPEMGNFFGGFAKRMRARESELYAEIEKLDKQMETLQAEIILAFAELKKYEIALENAKERARVTAARRETEAMDEIASQQHHRKQEDQ